MTFGEEAERHYSKMISKGSSDYKKEIIFGTRAVMEAISAGKEFDKLFIQKGLRNELSQELFSMIQDYKIPVSKVPPEKLNRITKKNHQGVIGFLSAVSYASLDNIIHECYQQGKDPFVIILDRVTDVRNFGAIARTAECMGVNAIVVPAKGSARISGDAMKASAGALNLMPVCREENLKTTIHYLQSSGFRIIACTEKAEVPIAHADLQGPLAILLGSEEDGISPEYLKLADEKAMIPITGRIASLNVSVAAAVALYEASRQRNQQ